jgi:tetratricopeptide (TPR) repeat protein
MEGSVRRAGSRVRVTAQLIFAGTGNHIWADRYDGAIEDIFDLQDQITEKVVGAIEPHLNRAEFERIKQKRPENLDAYDYTLRGLSVMNTMSPDDTASALDLFRKAIEADKNYARAYACASWCYRRHVQTRGRTLSAEDAAESSRLAQVALRLDGADPEVLRMAGITVGLVDGDLEAMTALIDRSLAINANSTRAWSASGVLRCILGEPERAIDDAEHSISLSPGDPSMFVPYGVLASAHLQEKRYQEAALWARKSIHLNRHNSPAYQVLAASCAHLHQLGEAQNAVNQMRELDPELTITRLQEIFPVGRYKNLAAFLDGLRKSGLPD